MTKQVFKNIEELEKMYFPKEYKEEKLILSFLRMHRGWYNRMLGLAKIWDKTKEKNANKKA